MSLRPQRRLSLASLPMKKTLSITKILLAVFFVFYPFAVFIGSKHLPQEILLAFIGIFFLARVLLHKRSSSPLSKSMSLVSLIMIVIICLELSLKQVNLIRLYPVFVNFGLLGLFILSLRRGHVPIIEKIARLKQKELPLQATTYLKKLTGVWSLFFLFNGLVSLFTYLYCTLEVWTFYNTFLSYIFIGTLAAGELVVRKHVKAKWRPDGQSYNVNS